MALEFTWKVETRGKGPYRRLLENMKRLQEKHDEELARAADSATEVSRRTFASKRSGRPFAAPRRGRRTTRGRFESHIAWLDLPGPWSFVIFDEDELEDAAPYYLINEVGTGSRATRYRHKPDGTLVAEPIGFASQKGRYIKPGLVWADGGNAVRPSRARYGQDQLHPAARVSVAKTSRGTTRRKRAAVNPLRTPRVRISKEIEPKHYIREGGKAGYAQYSTSIRSAARNTFHRKG